MTIKQFQITFYIFIGFCILLLVLAFTSFDFIEIDTAIDWTMKYFAIPIFILSVPLCSYIYLRFIQHHEIKAYNSKIATGLWSSFRIFILIVSLTVILVATTFSIIILTNGYLGDKTKITLNARILDYYTLSGKGPVKHYIKIEEPQLNRVVDLKVDGPYIVGQRFYKTMKIGKWGLLYSEK